ncbi:MAG TPA: bifunctional helix-turn-helix transcriptional regulator/GNAT family N-acetyltransferase [Gemmatimonadales bacterium]|nr:bifunctional helix-turn-helix transcriptional regulator/GNAT family N-acetyltransferase [Gemmatimonadales bacterium]
MLADQVAQVRRFNRLVTQRAGALDDHFIGRDRPLGASRLLYEIGPHGADLRDLRQRLGLDAGYVSRLAKTLARAGLVRLTPGRGDQRVRTARLTAAGRREVREMNIRSDQAANALLHALTAPQRETLVAAMGQVHRLLRVAGLRIERISPASPAARWCVAQYFAELDRRFEAGFDPATSLPLDDGDLIPPRGAFLMASLDGEPVACGAVKVIGPSMHTGYLKRMWVAATVRGLGIGRRMLRALEAKARELGCRKLCLETNKALQEAIALYRSAGFRKVPSFNDDPYADYWFEKRVGRTRPL